jgi:hypothetical protein
MPKNQADIDYLINYDKDTLKPWMFQLASWSLSTLIEHRSLSLVTTKCLDTHTVVWCDYTNIPGHEYLSVCVGYGIHRDITARHLCNDAQLMFDEVEGEQFLHAGHLTRASLAFTVSKEAGLINIYGHDCTRRAENEILKLVTPAPQLWELDKAFNINLMGNK